MPYVEKTNLPEREGLASPSIWHACLLCAGILFFILRSIQICYLVLVLFEIISRFCIGKKKKYSKQLTVKTIVKQQ